MGDTSLCMKTDWVLTWAKPLMPYPEFTKPWKSQTQQSVYVWTRHSRVTHDYHTVDLCMNTTQSVCAWIWHSRFMYEYDTVSLCMNMTQLVNVWIWHSQFMYEIWHSWFTLNMTFSHYRWVGWHFGRFTQQNMVSEFAKECFIDFLKFSGKENGP